MQGKFLAGSFAFGFLFFHTSNALAAADAPAKAVPQSASAEIMNVAEIQALCDAEFYSEAESKARSALKTFPNHAELYNLLGFSLRKQKKWAEAISAYDSALKLKPKYPQAMEYLAIAHLHTKNSKAAKTLYETLKKTHPELAQMISSEAKKLGFKW